MAAEPVDLYVLNKGRAGNPPIEGVVVRIYNEAGTEIASQQVTDSLGHAGFMLPAGVTYQVRLAKFGASLPNPGYIEVEDAPALNSFDLFGEILDRPIADDARFCRCSGYFGTAWNEPARGLIIHFIPRFRPFVLEGRGLFTERARKVSDANGYVEIDLVRSGQYEITIAGMEDITRIIHIPDLAGCNLPDVLLEVIDTVILSPLGPFALAVGEDLVLTPQVFTSSGRLLDGAALDDVTWGTDNPRVAAVVGATPTTITLRGLSAGSANLTVGRQNLSIVRIPNTPVQIDGAITVA